MSLRAATPAHSQADTTLWGGSTIGAGAHTRPTSEMDPIRKRRSRFTLSIIAVVTLLFAALMFVASGVTRSMGLLMEGIAFLGFFARIHYMIFFVNSSGASTGRLTEFRKTTTDLYVSMFMVVLVAMLLGAGVFNTVEDVLYQDHRIWSSLFVLCAAGAAVVFAIILNLCLALGHRLSKLYPDDRIAHVKAQNLPKENPKPPSAAKEQSEQQRPASVAKSVVEQRIALERLPEHMTPGTQYLVQVWFSIQTLVLLAGAIYGYFTPKHENGVDTILAFLMTPLPAMLMLHVLKDIASLLLEGVLTGLDFAEMFQALSSLDGVVAVRNLKIWTLKADRVSVAVTLVVDDFDSSKQIWDRAVELLRRKFKIDASAVDVQANRRGPDIDDTPASKFYQCIKVG